MVKFLHLADIHLASPFKGLRTINDHIAHSLREATFAAFSKAIDLCIKERLDFLLIAGDIYDDADRSLSAQLRFRDELARLSEASIPSYIVFGNHDPLSGWAAMLDWPPLVHIFRKPEVEVVTVTRQGKDIAHIYGLSFAQSEVRENLARKFQRQPGGPFAIALLHCNVGKNTGHEPYAPCSLADLTAAGFDYWALGHVHQQKVLHQQPLIVYPGNIQGRHPGEDDARGGYLVKIDARGKARASFVPLDRVRWYIEEISTATIDNEQVLLDELAAHCEQIRHKAEGRSVVVRFILKGRSRLHYSLQRPGFIGDLEERLRGQLGVAQPFAWVERVADKTRPPIAVEIRRQANDFIADLLQLIQQYRQQPQQLAELQRELSPLFQSLRKDTFPSAPDEVTLNDWLDAAEALCLDELVSEED